MKTSALLKYFILFLLIGSTVHAEEEDAIFSKGKVYVIYLKHGGESSGGGITVTNTRIAKFIGENYVIGSAVNGYLKEKVIRIPQNNVAMIMEYENEVKWRESIKQFYNGLQKNGANRVPVTD